MFVLSLRENVSRIGVLYRIWEKSVSKMCSREISRRGATSKYQISSTTWKQTWGRIQYLFKRELKKWRGELNRKREQTPSSRTQCLSSTAFQKGKKNAFGQWQSKRKLRIVTRLSHYEQPLSIVEDAKFQGLMMYLESRYTLPRRPLPRWNLFRCGVTHSWTSCDRC